MIGRATRAGTLAVCAALGVGLLTSPSFAADASVTGLSPAYGPVGTVVDITGSGLADVDTVAFGSGTPVAVKQPSTDAQVVVGVPAGATTGHLTLHHTDTATSPTVTTQTFTVQRPVTASISRSARIVRFPGTVTIRSVLTSGGQKVSGQTARLQHAVIGSGAWRSMSTAKTTGSTGVVQWSFTPYRSMAYRVVFRPTHTHLGTTSGHLRVYSRPQVRLNVPGVAPILTSIRLTGSVRPAPSAGAVYLDRLRDGVWHLVKHATATKRGHYAATVSLPSTGRYIFRFRRPADRTHLKAVSSRGRVVAVNRTLRQGMSGPDVRALQQRLTSLHYDVGGVNGSFGYDTLHAVVAFQKLQGLTRDGVVGTAVWSRLVSPRVPHLLHPFATAAGVEVDLTHQVIYYGVGGHIRRILDSSTGGGYYYQGSDGQTHQAITPTGHFKVVYKRDGWVTAPLGTLYRPAYFNYDGYAIHGEGEVPSYPASHGCVRITVPAMDRFNAKLVVGLSVWIYRT